MQEVWGDARPAGNSGNAGAAVSPPGLTAANQPESSANIDGSTKPSAPEATLQSGRQGPAAGNRDLSRYLDFSPEPRAAFDGVAGPSFLGLSGDPEAVAPEIGGRGRYVAAVAIGGLAVLLTAWSAMHREAARNAVYGSARAGTAYFHFLVSKASLWAHNIGLHAASADKTSSSVAAAGNTHPELNGAQHQAFAPPAPAPSPETADIKPAVPSQVDNKPAASPPENPAGAPANSVASAPSPVADKGADAAEARSTQQASADTPTKSEKPTEPDDKSQTVSKDRSEDKSQHVVKNSAAGRANQDAPKLVPGREEYRQALAATNSDVARALLWRATALGNTDAQVLLANLYLYGLGVPQNCEQGLILLRSAARKASAEAQGKLGVLYATGKCVVQDRVQAYRWLSSSLSAGQHNQWAERDRQVIWQQMSSEERSRAIVAGR